MKNKEILSAVIGGTFFAVPYLVLSAPIIPSLVIGAAAFGAGELVFGDYKLTLKDTNPSLYKMLDTARKQNKHILQMIPLLEDESLKKQLNEINDSVTKIIDTISKNPNKAKQTKKGASTGSAQNVLIYLSIYLSMVRTLKYSRLWKAMPML